MVYEAESQGFYSKESFKSNLKIKKKKKIPCTAVPAFTPTI